MAFQNMRFGPFVVFGLFFAFTTSVLLYLYYPVVPRSILGWIALFVFGLPTWIALEWLAGRLFGAKVFSRLSSGSRIAIGVPLLIAFGAVVAVLVRIGQWIIAGAP